jgi:predicted enzyme related to lactoylglutathione lyase
VIKFVAFFAYPVAEMERSRRFYEKTLGLTLSHNFQDKWTEYDISGSTLAITTMAEDYCGRGFSPGAKGGFIALEVDDLDSWVSRLREGKIPFLMEPFETAVCRMATVADPDGNGIILHQCKPGHR